MITREIKFRAYGTSSKTMSPVAIDLLGVAFQGQFAEQNKKSVETLFSDMVWMQFTGAKDQTGKEIYEGDIVAGEFMNEFGSVVKGKAEIGWCEHNHNWAVYINPKDPKSEHFLLNMPEELKIIGNSFENPELLP